MNKNDKKEWPPKPNTSLEKGFVKALENGQIDKALIMAASVKTHTKAVLEERYKLYVIACIVTDVAVIGLLIASFFVSSLIVLAMFTFAFSIWLDAQRQIIQLKHEFAGFTEVTWGLLSLADLELDMKSKKKK